MKRWQLEIPDLLITMDPGGTCGWSVYRHGRLVACGYGSKNKYLDECIVPPEGGVFLIERPRDYPEERREVDPNILLDLDHLAGKLEALYRLHGAKTEFVYPRTWKGNVPKAKRAGDLYLIEERLLARLDDREKALIYESKSARAKSINHNLVDAAFMGAWRLKRKRLDV